jgi:hypothetical protein
MIADPRFASLLPVRCATCGVAVRVAKFSAAHTSIQWTLSAMLACQEFGLVRAAGGEPALHDGCGRLRASISAAVSDGSLSIGDP